MAKGVRQQNAPLSFLGAALLAMGAVRAMSRPKRKLLWSKTLEPGQGVRIVSVPGE